MGCSPDLFGALSPCAPRPGRGRRDKFAAATIRLHKRNALVASAYYEEEHSYALIKTVGEPRANALWLVVKARGQNRDQATGIKDNWGMALDLLAVMAPEKQPFDWEALAAPAELRKGKGPGYDYLMAPRTTAGMSYGYYHARRLLKEISSANSHSRVRRSPISCCAGRSASILS